MIEPTKTSIEPLLPGRYIGTNGQWWVELRALDEVISLDLTPLAGGLAGAVAALAGVQESLDEVDGVEAARWPLDVNEVNAPATPRHRGRLEVTAHRPAAGEPAGEVGVLVTWNPTDGHANGERIETTLTWTGQCVRELGVEIEVENGRDREPKTLPAATVGEVRHDWVNVLRAAGIEARQVGETTNISHDDVRASLGIRASTSSKADADSPWNAVEVLRGLHDLMRRSSQSDLSRPAWRSHLLVLSRSGRKGLLGLMFDVDGLLPRQGCAVFADEIRDLLGTGERADFEVLRTVAHEIGHTLNLPHRFERGFANSASVMNYPWAYQGGNHVEQYYKACRLGFDPDELAFLHHAPRANVIPGGSISADLHPKWRMYPENEQPGDPVLALDLWLTPPAGGLDILPGEPVFLGVNLANVGARPVVLTRHSLDVKAGRLELHITRDGQQIGAHRPVLHRCYGSDPADMIRLGPGESMHDNVNLTMGASGPVFVHAGRYVITPQLSVPDRVASRSSEEDVTSEFHTITGRPLTITVSRAADRGLDAEFVQALGPEAGLGVMMAAPSWLPEAQAALTHAQRVSARRAAKAHKIDRFHAAFSRARAIDVLRCSEEPDYERKASELVAQCHAGAAETFDPHTRALTSLLLSQVAAIESSRRVVVDLGYPSGGGLAVRRVTGYLDVVASNVAPGVVAPLSGIPASALTSPDVRVSVTVTAPDGLVQQQPVREMKVITDEGEPVAAVIALNRSLKAADFGRAPVVASLDANSVWRDIAERRTLPDDPASLLDVASVADPPPSDRAPVDVQPAKAPATAEVGTIDITDVAGLAFLCRIVPWCNAEDDDPFEPDGTSTPAPPSAEAQASAS